MTPQLALAASVAAALAVIALKAAAWLITGSVGLLSDAVHSVVNLAGASFALLMVVLARRSVLALSERAARWVCTGAFAGALVLLFLYHVALHRAVVSYTYERARLSAVIPFGVGAWASEPLKSVLAEPVEMSGADPLESRHDVTWRHVQLGYEQLGPDGMAPFIPRAWQNLTLGLLLLHYCAVVSLIVLAFTTVAIRLGETPEEEEESG